MERSEYLIDFGISPKKSNLDNDFIWEQYLEIGAKNHVKFSDLHASKSFSDICQRSVLPNLNSERPWAPLVEADAYQQLRDKLDNRTETISLSDSPAGNNYSTFSPIHSDQYFTRCQVPLQVPETKTLLEPESSSLNHSLGENLINFHAGDSLVSSFPDPPTYRLKRPSKEDSLFLQEIGNVVLNIEGLAKKVSNLSCSECPTEIKLGSAQNETPTSDIKDILQSFSGKPANGENYKFTKFGLVS